MLNAGKVIKEARWRSGDTLGEFAQKLGVSDRQLRTWEKGFDNLDFNIVQKALELANLELDLATLDNSDEELILEMEKYTPTERAEYMAQLYRIEQELHNAVLIE
jgi:transcriptional regulator with XRE-family HTH domain